MNIGDKAQLKPNVPQGSLPNRGPFTLQLRWMGGATNRYLWEVTATTGTVYSLYEDDIEPWVSVASVTMSFNIGDKIGLKTTVKPYTTNRGPYTLTKRWQWGSGIWYWDVVDDKGVPFTGGLREHDEIEPWPVAAVQSPTIVQTPTVANPNTFFKVGDVVNIKAGHLPASMVRGPWKLKNRWQRMSGDWCWEVTDSAGYMRSGSLDEIDIELVTLTAPTTMPAQQQQNQQGTAPAPAAKYKIGDYVMYHPGGTFVGAWEVFNSPYTTTYGIQYDVRLLRDTSYHKAGHICNFVEGNLSYVLNAKPGDRVVFNGSSRPGVWEVINQNYDILACKFWYNLKNGTQTASDWANNLQFAPTITMTAISPAVVTGVLKPTQPMSTGVCVCSLIDLMAKGCKCGQIERERNKKCATCS